MTKRNIFLVAIVIVMLSIFVFFFTLQTKKVPVAQETSEQIVQRLANEEAIRMKEQTARLVEDSRIMTIRGLEEEKRLQPILLAEEWAPFTNTVLYFTFLHPKSLEVFGGGGDGYPPETLSAVMVNNIFSVEYIGNEKNLQNLSLKDFAKQIREVQIISASTSPNKQDGPLQKITVGGLPAYQFMQIEGVSPVREANELKMYGTENWIALGTHYFILLEDPRGRKLYIRYKPGNPISERMFKSFHFVR